MSEAVQIRPIDLLKKRHRDAYQKLKTASELPIQWYNRRVCADIIAKNLQISYQTVINYTLGEGKDGFLTEAICEEFKKLNSINNSN